MSKRPAHLFTPADLQKLSEDDRMAVMNMVKEKEITMEEAMVMVLGEARQHHERTRTFGKKISSVFGRGSLAPPLQVTEEGATVTHGLGRRGAMRKNRGRLLIDLSVQRASAFSVVILKVLEGRDLAPMNKDGSAEPFVKVEMTPDPTSNRDSKKKTAVRKHTRNPRYKDEMFTWEIRTGTELDAHRIKLSVWNQGSWRRTQFMGAFSFTLAEIWDDDTPTSGWFKLLDEKRGELQAIPFRIKKRDAPAAGGAKANPAAARRPLPDAPSPSATLPAQSRPAAVPAVSRSATVSPSKPKPKALTKVTIDSFNYLKVLGQGSFGKVLLAELKSGGDDDVFAIKVLSKEAVVEDDDVDCTMTERRVLALAGKCPFLTNLAATFQTPDRLYFVMEFVNGGDLMFHIQKLRKFSLEQTQFYCTEILFGLWYLHSHGILYRDLKLDNVMLDHEGHIKIADFGMCKENIRGAGTTTTFCGTPGYLAPEIIQELPYGASVDFWSLGVLTFEMLCGESPFEGDDEEELFKQILEHQVVYPKSVAASAKLFVGGLLCRKPIERLGCNPRTGQQDVKSHQFFASINWDKAQKRQLEPPYKPSIGGKKEVNNFDSEFTEAEVELSPPDASAIADIDQDLFRGFTFVSNQLGGSVDATAEVQAESTGSNLVGHSWYRPDLQRLEAVQELQKRKPGTFYVRESASQPGCYAIAMATEGGRVWNGLVTPTVSADGTPMYKLFVKHKFKTLPELIDYYCAHPVATDSQGRTLTLIKP